MNRKLVQHGQSTLITSLPSGWVKKNKLEKGDEIFLEEVDQGLLITPGEVKKKQASIELNIPKSRESAIRTLIVNAYRSGYDKIHVRFEGNKKDIANIVDNYLLGFELFEKSENNYSIEAVSEPTIDNFENIMTKQFQILVEMLKNIENEEMEEYVRKIQKYDNFLKHCISKQRLSRKGIGFFWQFISNLTQIARVCFHYHEDIKKYKLKPDKKVIEDLVLMVNQLREAYSKNDAIHLVKVHEYFDKIDSESKKSIIKKKDPLNAHHLTNIARTIYLANSPLAGLLYTKEY